MIDVVTGGKGVGDGVVEVGSESAAEIEESLAAVVGGDEEGGSGLNLGGDGVPILKAMTLDGAGKQKLLQRAPLVVVWMSLWASEMVFHARERESQPLQILYFIIIISLGCFLFTVFFLFR